VRNIAFVDVNVVAGTYDSSGIVDSRHADNASTERSSNRCSASSQYELRADEQERELFDTHLERHAKRGDGILRFARA